MLLDTIFTNSDDSFAFNSALKLSPLNGFLIRNNDLVRAIDACSNVAFLNKCQHWCLWSEANKCVCALLVKNKYLKVTLKMYRPYALKR